MTFQLSGNIIWGKKGVIVVDMAEIASFILRVAAPFLALIIVFLCFFSLRYGRRDDHALILLEDEELDIVYPVVFWENLIGRSRKADICITDPTVSREHAVLLRRSDGWFITDTGSKSGVSVNGTPQEGRCQVYIGDKIALGASVLTVKRTGNQKSDNEKRQSKTVSGTLLLLLISLYMAIISIESLIHMQNFETVLPSMLFVGMMWAFYRVSCKHFNRKSFELESVALMLSGTGVVLCAAHNPRQAYVQLVATALGIALFCFMLWFIATPDRVMKWRIAISVLAILMLGATLVLGKEINGAKNWIILGPVSIQPSEFAKIAYIFVGASTLDQLQTKKNLFGFILVTAICVGMLFYMSDLGTALVFFVTFLLIAFMRSGNLRTVVLALTAAVMGAGFVLTIKPYVAERFQAWGRIWEYADSYGYQQVNTLIYSASGGIFGVGISEGNLQYLFASENDLVFGLISEEMGLMTALLFAAVIGGFMLYARAVTTKSRSTFYSMAACSAGGMLVFQAALNIFGVVGLLPLTGVTLPFVSYGGSSMMACWGILAFIKAADERTYSHKKVKRKSSSPDEVLI